MTDAAKNASGDVEMKENNEDVEENTGIEAPGKSLEPLVGTMITLEEKDYNEHLVLVEIGTPSFAFKYTKQERVVVGKCEFCS